MTIKLSDAVATYVKMRDKIKARKREFDDFKKDLEVKMAVIELFLLKEFDKMGMESSSGGGHTAFKTFKDSVTVKDKEKFKVDLATRLLNALQSHKYIDMQGAWQPDGEADLEEHVELLVESGAFDLITLAANKNNCKQHMTDHDGQLPEGVEYRKETVIQIRKGKK